MNVGLIVTPCGLSWNYWRTSSLLRKKYKFRIDKNLYNLNNNIILRKPQNESEKTYIVVNDFKKSV